jgi:hypothetical protein
MLIWEDRSHFAEAELTEVRAKKLGDVTELDYVGHETYSSPQEMLDTYKGYYGDRVTFETEVKIINFKLL